MHPSRMVVKKKDAPRGRGTVLASLRLGLLYLFAQFKSRYRKRRQAV